LLTDSTLTIVTELINLILGVEYLTFSGEWY